MGGLDGLQNINPKLYKKSDERQVNEKEKDESVVDEFDSREVFGFYLDDNSKIICLGFGLPTLVKDHSFVINSSKVIDVSCWRSDILGITSSIISSCHPDLIREINDPEHPLTLEQLNVVEENLIMVDNEHNTITVQFTPTIPHCSMASLIGLAIRVQLLRVLPSRFKVNVRLTPGTHASEREVNKQLADKERVAAALENLNLVEVINQCIAGQFEF